MPNFTLRQMAESIGAADGASPEETDNLHTRLRGLVTTRALVSPVAMRGKAAEFDVKTVCVVRLLTTAADLGLDQFGLRPMRDAMLAPISPVEYDATPNVVHRSPTEIERAMKRIARGESVTFIVELRRYPDHPGTYAAYRFETAAVPEDGLADGVRIVSEAQRSKYRVVATLSLPASDLLRPLLSMEH